ncbi:MAG: hypothetical protein LBN34_07835 [Clostridiales Family XIII bacterium]|nr:hypothetical protein [Clostridiales Family XIII bacterium]
MKDQISNNNSSSSSNSKLRSGLLRFARNDSSSNGNSNLRKLLGRRASAVLLTLVMLTMAIVPQFAMATEQLEENDRGGGALRAIS